MIFSSIHTQDDYSNYPKAVQRAIEYLKSNDFTKMQTGVYEIEGKLLYAQVFDAMTEPVSDRKPEVHEKVLRCPVPCNRKRKVRLYTRYRKL